MEEYFPRMNHREFYLFLLLAFFVKFMLRSNKLFLIIYRGLQKIDDFLLARVGFLKKWSWVTVLELCR